MLSCRGGVHGRRSDSTMTVCPTKYNDYWSPVRGFTRRSTSAPAATKISSLFPGSPINDMGTQRRLYILDVGHGNCTVVDGGDSGTVVVDTAVGSALCEFLRERKITRIRTVYLSHADEDHIGGLVGLLASNVVQVERVVVNGDAKRKTSVWDDMAYELDAAHRAQRVRFEVGLVSGDGEDLGDVEVRVLAPSRYLVAKGVGGTDRSGRMIGSNSMSAVVRVSVSGRHVAVLPGDVDGVGLDDLVQKVDDAAAPVLVYPHHGGRPGRAAVRPFVEALLGAISPSVIVFSFGRRRYSLPNEETIRMVRERRPGARIVCTQLSLHCSVTVPPQPLEHLSEVFASGRAERGCCGGTIVVPLDDVEGLEPLRAGHLEFIRANVATPLCLRDF